jgi:hypothetical protein
VARPELGLLPSHHHQGCLIESRVVVVQGQLRCLPEVVRLWACVAVMPGEHWLLQAVALHGR